MEANVSFQYSITGNQLTVDTRTKFFKQGVGKYFVTVYIYEDSIPSYQYNNTTWDSIVEKRVLRTPILDPTMWGNKIDSGTVAVNSTYDVQFQQTLNPTWNVDKLGIVVAIWKVHASNKYEAINCEDVPYAPSVGISNNAQPNTNKVMIYPNPVKESISIMSQEKHNQVIVFDVMGNEVLKKKVNNDKMLDVKALKDGVYFLSIYSNHKLIGSTKFIKQ